MAEREKAETLYAPRPEGRERAEESPEIGRALRALAKEIRFGSVEIVVHDSKVVRIVRTEKVRLG